MYKVPVFREQFIRNNDEVIKMIYLIAMMSPNIQPCVREAMYTVTIRSESSAMEYN